MRLVPLMLTMSSSSAASTVNNHATMLGDGPFEEVEKVKYLGSMFVAYNQGIKETRSTINLSVLSAFSRLKSCLWFRRKISSHTKRSLPGSSALDFALRLRNVASSSGRRNSAGVL